MAGACRAATLEGLAFLSLSCCLSRSSTFAAVLFNRGSTGRPLPGIELPDHLSFNAAVRTVSAEPGCRRHPHQAADAHEEVEEGEGPQLLSLADAARGASTLKLQLKRRYAASGRGRAARSPRKQAVLQTARRDLHRIQTLRRRITVEKYQNAPSGFAVQQLDRTPILPRGLAGQVATTLESGATLGYGEFLADVFVGTPPRRFSLVIDTGSDLSWLQCLPCYDCFEQRGPYYDPALSSSHRPVPCDDPRCHLVPSPDNPRLPCRGSSQICRYFYWHGDGESNTTGDLALETFTVGLAAAHRVEDVIFGCGHWNRGRFRAAAGLLGLGRGPIGFPSRLGPRYGGVFSYCLVDWHSDLSVTGNLLFGKNPAIMAHLDLNFTSLVDGAVDTFYYVRVKGIKVAGELLDIPPETWELSPDGQGGSIIDSGATLSRFAGPAYRAIGDAVTKTVNGYPAATAEEYPELGPCYNVSGAGKAELPEFAIMFAGGAVWNFPAENFFIRLGEVECMVALGAPSSTFSMILGNYQQQNFHVVYDAGRSRLGFAPARCAEV